VARVHANIHSARNHAGVRHEGGFDLRGLGSVWREVYLR
jgi:hypothetical protein